MPSDTSDAMALADVVETVVKAAIAPLVLRVRAMETAAADLAVATLRERIAVVEAREPVPGPPGPPGVDGLGFDDYAVKYDGERSITFTWTRADGGISVESVIRVPMMLYRGVYVVGKVYDTGDCVTWAGSLWHCNAETTTRPGDGSPAWTLAVKRGRDGK